VFLFEKRQTHCGLPNNLTPDHCLNTWGSWEDKAEATMTGRTAAGRPLVSGVSLARASWDKSWNIPLLIGLLGLGADQLSKSLVRGSLPVGAATPLEGVIRLRHVANDGIMFGVDASSAVSLVLPFVLIIATLFLCQRYVGFRSQLLNTALALFVCGGLGNLMDRLLLGHVTDFIDVSLPGGAVGVTLNLADLCVMVGAILFATFAVKAQREVDGHRPRPGSL
jgi:signal peptidase II